MGEDAIADLTHRLRNRLGITDQVPLDIVRVIESLVGLKFPRKGPLHLRVFPKVGDENDAELTFSPLTLDIEEEIWFHAKMGDPWSCFVLAHELGYAFLHDLDAKAFSGKEQALECLESTKFQRSGRLTLLPPTCWRRI